MLQKRIVNGITYNDIPESAYKGIPAFTKPVTVGLHTSRSALLAVSQTRNPNDDSPILETNSERRHGRIFEKAKANYFDSTTGATSPVAVFEGNNLFCLDFDVAENVKVIYPENPVHKQLYFFLHVCGFCKTTLSDELLEDYKFQIIDIEKTIEVQDNKEMVVMNVKNSIIEASKDEEGLINIAKDLGYIGTGSFKDARLWLMKLAETNTSDVKFALSQPDVADLKRKVRRALKENILVYRPSDSKIAFDGAEGKALISSTKNEDFEERVQNLYRYLVSAGNNDAFLLFNKKIQDADLRIQELAGIKTAKPSKVQTASDLL